MTAPLLILASVDVRAVDSVPEVLLKAPGIEVTTLDVQAELQRVPADKRAEVLTKPETVGQIVQNLYLRRALTQSAEKAGLGKDPLLVTLTRLNRERLMTDAMLEHMDKLNALKDSDAEKLAANEYRVNAKKFEAPEEVHVAHILVRSGVDKEAAKAKAEAILKELKNGADFATLAKEKSDDPGSAAKGGDLGNFGRGKMVKSFEDAAFALKKSGDLSEIVESQFGFHILKLESHTMPYIRPYSEIKADLIKEIQQKAIMDARKLEAERLNNEATIQSDTLMKFVESQKPASAQVTDGSAVPAK